jgi:hypothetical protein
MNHGSVERLGSGMSPSSRPLAIVAVDPRAT